MDMQTTVGCDAAHGGADQLSLTSIDRRRDLLLVPPIYLYHAWLMVMDKEDRRATEKKKQTNDEPLF